mmetsp:Transcript_80420/g.209784  ORF Transcript_80420/g.209784 Transcript_80420/m.209784 type:complete len:546 (-) Transcript_80420:327-1964(-)
MEQKAPCAMLVAGRCGRPRRVQAGETPRGAEGPRPKRARTATQESPGSNPPTPPRRRRFLLPPARRARGAAIAGRAAPPALRRLQGQRTLRRLAGLQRLLPGELRGGLLRLGGGDRPLRSLLGLGRLLPGGRGESLELGRRLLGLGRRLLGLRLSLLQLLQHLLPFRLLRDRGGLLGLLLHRLLVLLLLLRELLLLLLCELLSCLLGLPAIPLSFELRLLLLEHGLVHLLNERLRGLADDHPGDLGELVGAELFQVRGPVLRAQVLLHLHEHVVAGHARGDGLDHAGGARVVEEGQPSVEVGLVVGTRPALALPHPALDGPLIHFAVAELGEGGVALQPAVEPVERALVRQAHGEDDGGLARGGSGLHGVGLGRVLHHPACERQRRHRRLPEVHLHGDVAERDVGEERLALEVVRERHRFAHAHAGPEEAHGVGIRALGIQVDEHSNDHVTAELAQRLGRFGGACPEGAVRVESHAPIGVAEEERRVCRGEAHAQELLGLLGPVLALALVGAQQLEHLHLEHVPAGLQPHVGAGAADEVLHSAVG